MRTSESKLRSMAAARCTRPMLSSLATVFARCWLQTCAAAPARQGTARPEAQSRSAPGAGGCGRHRQEGRTRIPGLAAKDFHVFEDGKEQAITAFQTHAGPTTPGMPATALLHLLFDGDSNNDLPSIQQPAARFIADNAGPNRLMSIAYYSSGCMTIATQFTADVVELQHALATLPSLLRRCGFVTDPDGDLQASYCAQLAKDLAHVPGHKVLALFVANAAPEVSAPARSVNSGRQGLGRSIDPVFRSSDPSARASQLSGLTPGIAAPPRNAARDLFGMEAEFRKADVSIYPVETQTGGRSPGWALKLADATGGRELDRGNDVAGAFNLLAREQDEVYTLGYVPPESPEGSCHALKITIDRPDAKVRGRNLYCNVREVSLAAANPLEQELENLAVSTQAGNARLRHPCPTSMRPTAWRESTWRSKFQRQLSILPR
jgi:VWFA-related protein